MLRIFPNICLPSSWFIACFEWLAYRNESTNVKRKKKENEYSLRHDEGVPFRKFVQIGSPNSRKQSLSSFFFFFSSRKVIEYRCSIKKLLFFFFFWYSLLHVHVTRKRLTSFHRGWRSSIKLYLLYELAQLSPFSQLINFTKGRKLQSSPFPSLFFFEPPLIPSQLQREVYPPPRILIKILFYARLNVNDALKRAEIQAGIISYEDRRIISAFRS